MRLERLALVMAAWALAAPSVAQTNGSELRLNAYTTSLQSWPSVALQPGGGWVAVWQSYQQDGSGFGVYGRRFQGGTPGPEFRVNTTTTGRQYYGKVAAARDGSFVVVWSSAEQSLQGAIMTRRFGADGAPRGAEFRVSASTTLDEDAPAVAAASDGGYMVTWTRRDGPQDFSTDVFSRRLDASGAPVGAEVRVNTYTTDSQILPSLAQTARGDWIVVWDSFFQDGSDFGVFGRRLDAAGQPLGAEFQSNTHTTHTQDDAVVAAGARDGSFVVAWTDWSPKAQLGDIMVQRYRADGVPRGAAFSANAPSTLGLMWPGAAMDETGAFVVSWHTYQYAYPVPVEDVMARRFEADGTARGAEFRVNTDATGLQARSVVASDAVGNFTVAWQSRSEVNGDGDVSAQRYGGLVPDAEEADRTATSTSDGNGVIEPNERVRLVPSWRNLRADRVAPLGTLSSITGPGGGTYEIVVADADYGPIEPGSAGHCSSCPEVRISGPRPATHWDAAAEEHQLEFMGQHKAWLLHLGDSFNDVARSRPTYRFVETLLHRGITSGCTAVSYCPTLETTREQMAVLVLLAREGAGYRPPACGTPRFGDVPASSPYCPFVEEVARRGIAGGCASGLYCPTQAVTREQTAVFVLRALDPSLVPPPCAAPPFGDVPASSPFCPWIQELSRRGIVAGCGGGDYCPGVPVTREQMAVFLTATFGLALYGP
jgi:hypothetical protein